MRSQPDQRFLPIIMLTTETDIILKDKGKAAGASAWVGKPFQPGHLLSIVNIVLGQTGVLFA